MVRLKFCFPEFQMTDFIGTVYKAKWLSKNRQVACKVLTVSSDRENVYKSFVQELGAYNELSGAYILKLYGYACEQSAKDGVQKFTLVMEYMGQGSLTNVIQANKISLRQKLEMAWHVANGMKKIHARRMIHRDIRPDNILVNDFYTAKIGDMGIARSMTSTEEQTLTQVGCQPYMPPEFFTGKYDQSLDVFTFGLTLYHLFTGTKHLYDSLLRRVSLPLESPIFNELIQFCTDDKPKRRPSAVEIEIALNLYRRPFDKFIRIEHPKYEEYSMDYKNDIFMKFYDTFHSQVTEKMTNQLSKYSSTLDDGEDNEYMIPNLNVILQWLMQVMKEQ